MSSHFQIDKRPLLLLFFKEYKNAIALLFIVGLFLLGINAPHDYLVGLSDEGYRALIIFLLAVTLWVTNLLPLSITSLLVMGLLASYKVMDSKSIYSFFGNTSLFFIIGAFIISAGVQTSGLSKRVAHLVVKRFGTSPFALVVTIFTLSSGLSHLMPEHGVAALMFPIVLEIIGASKIKKGSAYGGILFFAMAWGCIIGGVVTFLGGARNPLAIGILEEMTGETISMLRWIIAAAPPMYLLSFLVLAYFGFVIKREPDLTIDVSDLKKLEKISFREIKAGVILVITIIMWVFFNQKMGIASTALISASLYFVLNVISWDEANREINWGVIFMYGGAIAMGSALDKLGVLKWFVDSFLIYLPMNKPFLVGLLAISSMLLTNLMSNAAVIVILLPVAINLAKIVGLPPEFVTMAVAIPAGLAYILPMSTPAMAIIFGSGYVDSKQAIRRGFVLNIVSWLVFWVAAIYYWPLIGIK